MSTRRALVIFSSLLILASTIASCVLATVRAFSPDESRTTLLLVVAAALAIAGVTAGGTAMRSVSGSSVVILLSAVVAVIAHAVLISETLNISGQPLVGYVGIGSGILLVVSVVAGLSDRQSTKVRVDS